ncbi:MAG: hypothetical protein IKN63_06025 [Bacilli bacterium]|nr:hypothetical protein [Bacilli bacterium]
MRTSNKISIIRIVLTFIIILSCTFPFYSLGINAPKLNIGGVIVESLYLLSGVIFILTIVLDLLGSGSRAESEKEKNLDMLADKFLINSVLIIFAVRGFIPVLVPIIYIIRDEIVYVLKIDAARRGKILNKITASRVKTFAMLFGLCLMFFYNLPFELINIKMADFLIYFGTIMAIVSGIEYYNLWRKVK